jgi:tRNA(fMet)-specific endonuclease VapC
MVSARFLLDSNAVREPLRPEPDARFLRKFQLHRGALAIAAPAWHEALFGLFRMPDGPKKESVEDYLFHVLQPSVDLLPYDAEAARWHASERARLEGEGSPAPFADGQIAAVAARFGLTLVTHNERGFRRFNGITLVDWMGDGTAW